jgi:hypothetical protein
MYSTVHLCACKKHVQYGTVHVHPYMSSKNFPGGQEGDSNQRPTVLEPNSPALLRTTWGLSTYFSPLPASPRQRDATSMITQLIVNVHGTRSSIILHVHGYFFCPALSDVLRHVVRCVAIVKASCRPESGAPPLRPARRGQRVENGVVPQDSECRVWAPVAENASLSQRQDDDFEETRGDDMDLDGAS